MSSAVWMLGTLARKKKSLALETNVCVCVFMCGGDKDVLKLIMFVASVRILTTLCTCDIYSPWLYPFPLPRFLLQYAVCKNGSGRPHHMIHRVLKMNLQPFSTESVHVAGCWGEGSGDLSHWNVMQSTPIQLLRTIIINSWTTSMACSCTVAKAYQQQKLYSSPSPA